MGGNGTLGIELQAKVSEYLDFVMTLIFAFGLCFQLPVLLSLLGRVGIVSSAQLRSVRRYAIVGLFAVAAILTPPDVFSMMSLAVPLVALYEISILLRLADRTRPTQERRGEGDVRPNPSWLVFDLPRLNGRGKVSASDGRCRRVREGRALPDISPMPLPRQRGARIMHDIKAIRDDTARFVAGLKRRGIADASRSWRRVCSRATRSCAIC